MEAPAVITERALVFERRIAAPPERVWRALTEPEDLRAWLARAELELRPGAAIVLTFENEDEESVMRGTIIAVEEGRVLEFSWGEDDIESVVRFEVARDGDGTRLTLTHTFERVDDLSGFGAGWHHHLELLVAYASGSPAEWDWERFRALRQDYETLPRA
jgi:uncharacterized protein YndB with AHSA1/START domain